MKRLVLTLLVVATLIPARAQLFSPEAFSGAAFGAMLGSIIGGDCHGPSGEGAAIGAGIGLLAGALAGEANRRNTYYSEPVSYVSAPSVSFGYGYSGCGSLAYVYYSPNYYTAPGYHYRPVSYQPAARPNYAVNGTLLGAASGALIGAGNEQAGKGAAIGAAAGLVAGGIAEHQARKQERRVATEATALAQQPSLTDRPVTRAQPEVVRSEITSRPVATSTYTWTQRPQQQIADAPRVPDAPTF